MSREVRLVDVPDFRKIKSLFDFRVERDRSGAGLFVATKAFSNYDVATYQLARKAPAFWPGMDSAESAGLHCGG